MPEYDLIIRDGMVIDGTRMPRFRADIGIKNGRIAKIGRLRASDAAKSVDASGHIVAPGFVDLHTHYDAQLFWDPYCSISSWHGVTSIVIGNCGFGFAPVKPECSRARDAHDDARRGHSLRLDESGMPWDWTTFPEFLDSIDRRPKAVNILPYVSVSPLLTYVMGIEEAKNRPPTEQEEREICRLLDEAMDAGACGWSAQRLDPEGSRMRAARLRRHADGVRSDDRRHLLCARARARTPQRGLHADDAGLRRSEQGPAAFREARGHQRAPDSVQRRAAARLDAVHPSRDYRVAGFMPSARAARIRAGGHQRHQHDLQFHRLESLRRGPGVVRGDHRHYCRAQSRSSAIQRDARRCDRRFRALSPTSSTRSSSPGSPAKT